MIGPSAVLVAFRKAASSRRSPKSPSRRSTYGASVAAREAGARPVAHGVSRGRQAAAYAQPQRGERGAASFARSTGFRSPVPLTHGSRRGLRSYVPAGPVSAATDQPVRQSERTESGGGMTSGLCCSCRGHPALECRGHLSRDEVVFEAGTASRREGKMPSPHSGPATQRAPTRVDTPISARCGATDCLFCLVLLLVVGCFEDEARLPKARSRRDRGGKGGTTTRTIIVWTGSGPPCPDSPTLQYRLSAELSATRSAQDCVYSAGG